MSKVSIVVPVYKVEKYLKRCVDSILNQSFSDFDLILVDDGSPDCCPEMCDQIAQTDNRVTVVHQKNGGLSAARNAGIEWALKNSDSEWITFIDSDDWVHPQFLEISLKVVQDNKLSVCLCYFLVTPEYCDIFEAISGQDCTVMKTEDAFRTEALDPNSSCGRLFKKALFEEMRFPVGKLHEDRFTTYKVLFRFPEVCVVHKPMYFYYVNSEGIVHSEWSPRKLDDLEATAEQMEFFKSNHMVELYQYTVRDYIHLLIYTLKNVKGRNEYRVYEKEVRKNLQRILRAEKKSLGLSLKKNFNIYKYAYPLEAKIYRRIFMR